MTRSLGQVLIAGTVSFFALGAPVEQVVIIGGGPAGYTAALYAARAGLEPLVLEGTLPGGQLIYTNEVENYPGYPDGVSGIRMMDDFRRQAQRFGARFLAQNAEAIRPASAGAPHQVVTEGKAIAARAVILAMGAQYRKLGVPGEAEWTGKGVSYCGTCDAPLFRGKETVVAGGGDSAMEDALFLAKFASKVTIVHRRAGFRASRIMLDRARATPNIHWLAPFTVQAFQGGDRDRLARVVVSHAETGQRETIPAQGAFVAIGQVPQSDLVKGSLPLDGKGYVLTDGRCTRTGIPGIFAAGDLVDHTYRQAVTAAGSGCMAALDAERYLADPLGHPPAGCAPAGPAPWPGAGPMTAPPGTDVEQVLIIGGGPAGYTAALYAARAGLKPLVLEGPLPGGQPNFSPEVENYPGYPDGVSGPRMMADFRRQGERFGARFLAQSADAFHPASAGSPHRVGSGGRSIAARAVILAMGAQPRRLGAPGEAELIGKGVSYCGICDGSVFRGQETVVVGGGDSALEEALFLARFAAKVTIVHDGAALPSQALLARAKAVPNIQWRAPRTVQAFQAGEGGLLERVVLNPDPTGKAEAIPARGAFVALGQVPQTALVRTSLALDGTGHVPTDGGSTRTAIPGVFATGDLVDPTYHQSVTAASSGCKAALDAERYLS